MKVTIRADEIQAGDRMAWLDGYVKVLKITRLPAYSEIEFTMEDPVYRTLYFKYDDVRIVMRKVERTCTPCYDSDCDCIWDEV